MPRSTVQIHAFCDCADFNRFVNDLNRAGMRLRIHSSYRINTDLGTGGHNLLKADVCACAHVDAFIASVIIEGHGLEGFSIYVLQESPTIAGFVSAFREIARKRIEATARIDPKVAAL